MKYILNLGTGQVTVNQPHSGLLASAARHRHASPCSPPGGGAKIARIKLTFRIRRPVRATQPGSKFAGHGPAVTHRARTTNPASPSRTGSRPVSSIAFALSNCAV